MKIDRDTLRPKRNSPNDASIEAINTRRAKYKPDIVKTIQCPVYIQRYMLRCLFPVYRINISFEEFSYAIGVIRRGKTA